MDRNELLKKVTRIDIKTRALSSNIFAGEYHSAFKGRGMAFSEVREYQSGDDVRDIDWNVTARLNRPHIKVYEEERELTVMLLVDVSSSLAFGTQSQFQREMVAEIAATLAYSAIQNNDKIGVILFSDKIEKYIPPKKGRKHILFIISQLLEFKPESQKTNIKLALEFLMQTQHKSCTTFLISDFLDNSDFSQALNIVSRKHDMAAIQVYDQFLEALPNVGLIEATDLETGSSKYIDTSSQAVRAAHSRAWIENQDRLQQYMLQSKTDIVRVRTNESYVKALINLFAQRGRK